MTIFLHKHDIPSEIQFGNAIAIDTETMGLNIVRDRLCLVQLSAGDGNAHLVQFEAKKYEAPNLKKLLSDNSKLKIFHFARFDLTALLFYLGIEMENIYCTKIASKLIRTYSDSHGLKALCDELIGVELSKKQQTSYWGNFEISEKQKEYAASDVLHLHRLKEKLDQMLKRENRTEIFAACLKFLPARVKLDLQGFSNVDIFAHN
ncbi:MAG: 3'-5' exonuclease [Alphaproteobacteria bacterium RIFCSPLOWO2_01_FULL_40_26]|nr:MAG: 3'-5' exonuclease [Alphaproteobacteria bacterium RIFCSPHIGHO2_02_FULL_40_34]OFW87161.1 MAG: 3'-5' exonuclease [Alphaproteobacteria bacterium RIFCSPHIGHO2_01_FULL_40_8]OFW93972.1 MAG: 3'-5' exonuclease [Alphaproteobacteria bacterium RIFCSPLOWO2_01_FULL_40_26]OFX09684.1 MAG: 3'-5' exonuclease [Alphaproteobacteria bacterium RIFCSPLOWO2_02_FULL_40_19]OFX10833.1 MAG: 3'-5' exonuclease [Alphaproteobacteria bacterium RIFCSPLOWO2_12_FULL_40_11]